jgi:hypothetical protein
MTLSVQVLNSWLSLCREREFGELIPGGYTNDGRFPGGGSGEISGICVFSLLSATCINSTYVTLDFVAKTHEEILLHIHKTCIRPKIWTDGFFLDSYKTHSCHTLSNLQTADEC